MKVCPLAVFVPALGACPETFIRRHIDDLLPGHTAVVAGTHAPAPCDIWAITGPALILDEFSPQPHFVSRRARLNYFMRKGFGYRIEDGHDKAVREFLVQHGVAVILGEYLDTSLRWLLLAQDLGIRFWGHAHGYDVSRSLRDPKIRRQYLGYNQADGIITVNQPSRQRLIDLGVRPEKITVIPCGVDVPAQLPSRSAVTPVRCVAVGRMVPKKAPILLLDAFRRAHEKCEDIRLDYIGDGVLMSVAQEYLTAFRLEDAVRLHGVQPHARVQQLMRTADIFLQHSVTDPVTGDAEGLPVAILEAMANALPVISTRHEGIPEAVVDGETGYLVSEGDVSGMAERIVDLALSITTRTHMGRAGWARVQEGFSWKRERTALLDKLGISEL